MHFSTLMSLKIEQQEQLAILPVILLEHFFNVFFLYIILVYHDCPKAFFRYFSTLFFVKRPKTLIYFYIKIPIRSKINWQVFFLTKGPFFTHSQREKRSDRDFILFSKQVLRSTILSSTIVSVFFDNSRIGRFQTLFSYMSLVEVRIN